MKFLFIFLLSVPTVLSQASKDWIDPHDMNVNVKHYMKKASSTGDLINKNQDCNLNVAETNSLIYLKRVINLILNSANIQRTESAEHHGHIHFSISDEDLSFLKSFVAKNDGSLEDFRKIDTILSKSLERSYIDGISDIFISSQEKLYEFVTSKNGLPILGLSLFLYIAYNLFKSNFSLWYVLRYFLFMVYIIDFIQRYQYLYEEAEEHNMHLKYSLKCDTSKMSWGQYFKFMTSNEDCEKKVISLLEVALNQVKSIIIVPLASAGTGMGQFASGLWKNLPFPWNILIFPIMLVFCAILTAIVMTTMNNTPFKFNIMHLFHLEFGEKKAGITGKTLDKLLDAVNHRPLLQEVKSASEKTPPKKNKSKAIDNRTEDKEEEKEVGNVKNTSQTKIESVQEQFDKDYAGNSD